MSRQNASLTRIWSILWSIIVDVGLCGTDANTGATFCDKSCDDLALIGVKLNETFWCGESFKLPFLSSDPSISISQCRVLSRFAFISGSYKIIPFESFTIITELPWKCHWHVKMGHLSAIKYVYRQTWLRIVTARELDRTTKGLIWNKVGCIGICGYLSSWLFRWRVVLSFCTKHAIGLKNIRELIPDHWSL